MSIKFGFCVLVFCFFLLVGVRGDGDVVGDEADVERAEFRKSLEDIYGTQPTYAIGSVSGSYPGYTPYYFPSNDIQNFIAAYNNFGGLPSLGVYGQYNCLFNVLWDGFEQHSCSCPLSAPVGTIQQVIAQGNQYCTSSISYSITPVSSASGYPGLSFYISTGNNNPSCPGGCSLHGDCVNSVCVCDTYFSGADCSTFTPPSGFFATLYSITWTNTASAEFLRFGFEPSHTRKYNCTIFLRQMPSQQAQIGSPLVSVQDFSSDEYSFSFSTHYESELSIIFWVLSPDHNTLCQATSFQGDTQSEGNIQYFGGTPSEIGPYFLLALPNYGDD